jgi:hypothetical protein
MEAIKIKFCITSENILLLVIGTNIFCSYDVCWFFFFLSPGSGTQYVMTKQVKDTRDRSKWKQRKNSERNIHISCTTIAAQETISCPPR